MFGIFKRRKQKELVMALVRAAAEGESRAKVNRALGTRAVQISSGRDNADYSIRASAAIVRTIAREAEIPIGEGSNEDDDFVAGIWGFVVSNHISFIVGASFEMVSSVVVIDLFGVEAAGKVQTLITAYNRMNQEGRVIEAIGQSVANWISVPSDDRFDKLVALYKLCRENVGW